MNPQALIIELAACFLSLTLTTSVLGQEVNLSEARPKITTVSAVRARTGPQVAASEIMRLKLGTVVSAVARSVDPSELGGSKDYWYRVNLPNGTQGWVFGGLLLDYDYARRPDIFRQIIDERLKVEAMSFEDGVDYYNFVVSALAEIKEPSAKGELELLRLHALGRAVAPIPGGQHESAPYHKFHKAHEREIYYHESAGGWAVRPEMFWNLELKYRGSAVGDRIAWDAAQALRQGECESDEVCQFLALHDTEGKYVSLYPRGAHSSEALQNIAQALSSEELTNTLKSKGGDKYLVEEQTALRKALAELRAAVSKTTAAEKPAILQRLDQLSRNVP